MTGDADGPARSDREESAGRERSDDGEKPTDREQPGGRAALVEALEVPRNARRGFAFGLLFTVAVFVFFVVLPGTYRSPLFYVGLGFVLAVAVGGLATTVLTAITAYRLSREL